MPPRPACAPPFDSQHPCHVHAFRVSETDTARQIEKAPLAILLCRGVEQRREEFLNVLACRGGRGAAVHPVVNVLPCVREIFASDLWQTQPRVQRESCGLQMAVWDRGAPV